MGGRVNEHVFLELCVQITPTFFKSITDSSSVIADFRLMVEQCEAKEKPLKQMLADHCEMQTCKVDGPLGKNLIMLCVRECHLRLTVPTKIFLPTRVHMKDLIELTYRDVPSAHEVQRLLEGVLPIVLRSTGQVSFVPAKGHPNRNGVAGWR